MDHFGIAAARFQAEIGIALDDENLVPTKRKRPGDGETYDTAAGNDTFDRVQVLLLSMKRSLVAQRGRL
jgi:hypothetical protein